MLYEAVQEPILKKGYKVKYVSLEQPGRNPKYVPVYRSPNGEEVFEDEAMAPGITIVEVPDVEATRVEREQAITKLTAILLAEPTLGQVSPVVDWRKFKDAIKGMSFEADLKLEVGASLADKLVADKFYHEFPEAEYVVSFLVESGLKDAIVPLTSLLAYETSWDHSGAEDFVHNLARTTLRKFVAGNPEFQCEAARAALALHADKKGLSDYYRDLRRVWAVELLTGLANSGCPESDWACEQLSAIEG
jgi:hypothetical protein